MSLIENLINQISMQGLGGITKPQGFDLNDTTFEKLLMQEMNRGIEGDMSGKIQNIGNMGAPAGFVIEPIDAPQSVAEIKPIDTSDVQIKEINTDDYITNQIKHPNESNKGFFDFAQKHAANAYNVFAGKYVADLKDFIGDAVAML